MGFEFALPTVLGDYLDRRWAIRPVGLLVGMILGFAAGMVHILKIARDGAKSGSRGAVDDGAIRDQRNHG